MIRISAQTKLNPENVIERAEKFFGKNGHGLEACERTEGYITFNGGGGMVEITACYGNNDSRTTVEIATQEWDSQVKEFVGKLPS